VARAAHSAIGIAAALVFRTLDFDLDFAQGVRYSASSASIVVKIGD
jgi:hypothetical protein